MSLLIAGIDEAGYGPTLGPLCVGMSVFRIRDWNRGDPAPDLWKLLKAAVCKKPGDTRRRIPIADSKAIKLPNDSPNHHPLIHLERGVLSFLRWLDHAPATDAALFSVLNSQLDTAPWYCGEAIPIPVGQTEGEISIAAARLGGCMEKAGVELVGLYCHLVHEPQFNDIVRQTGTKAEATAHAFGHHLRRLSCHGWPLRTPVPTTPDEPAPPPVSIRLVCDQLGGRTSYEGLIARELPESEVTALAESGERSRYSVRHKDHDPDFIIQFMPEAESAHLPVALASMVAKLTRELIMKRFNRYWCIRSPEIKPTAGYSTDARRWLNEMQSVIEQQERAAMVRLV